MWKQLASKEIFSHPRIVITEDTVQLPSGAEVDYLKFKEGENYATIICKNSTGKILLQKEYSYPPNQELFQFPGGGIGEREDISEGANRELMEESGLRATCLTHLGSYLTNNRRSNSRMHVFLATNLEDSHLAGDQEESIKSQWFSEREIEDLIKTNQIINVHVLAAWTLYSLKTQSALELPSA